MFTTIEIFGISITRDALFWIVAWPTLVVGFLIYVWLDERRWNR